MTDHERALYRGALKWAAQRFIDLTGDVPFIIEAALTYKQEEQHDPNQPSHITHDPGGE